MERYYAAADIFILPSLYEPFSNACLEALACGLPVFTSRSNGVSEIMDDGENGLILDNPFNTDEIREKINRLTDARYRERVSANARLLAESNNIEANIEDTTEVYRKYLSGIKSKQ